MIGVWGLIALGLIIGWFCYDLPNLKDLSVTGRKPSITYLARDGQKILTMGDYYAKPVDAKALPAHVKNAFLAIEDRRFYSHWGVDPWGLARAFYRNFTAGSVVQGGSTITQQLAKNFLTTKGLFHHTNRSLRRKVQEVIMAFWLERHFTKDQILTLYLNRVYFGAGAYGLEAASHQYFNRNARDLNLYEAAILAGMMKAPSKYSPFSDQELSLSRGKQVLTAMIEGGFLDGGKLKSIDPPRFGKQLSRGASFARFFTDWIYEQLPVLLGGIDHDLIVTTTLDISLQSKCEEVIERAFLTEAPSLNCHEGAVVALSPAGAVRAMVGGKHYYSSPFNRAYQAYRQSGSAFKYFVYLAALEAGYTPNSAVLDAPFKAGKWAPRNYSRRYMGEVSLQDAFAYSLNTVSARLTQDVGVRKIQEMASRLGLVQDQTNDLTISLGVGDASLLEMTAAFATIPNGGYKATPYGILHVQTTKGKTLYEFNRQDSTILLSPQVVQEMNQLLQAVMVYGTGKSIRLENMSAGKTGTTQSHRDAWFIGYTPQIVLGVWTGNDNNTPMDKVMGAGLPGRIWKRILE